MRNSIKLFAVMFCCAAAMALTSCLNSDSGESTYIDTEYQTTLQASMAGPYTGQMLFYKPSADNSTSLNNNYATIKPASWYAQYPIAGNDSTITVSADGIAGALATAFKNSDTEGKYSELVTALSSPVQTTPVIKYCIPSTSAITSSGMYLNAVLYISVKVNYGGADHYVYFRFTAQNGYYAGQWTTAKKMQLSLVLYDVHVTDTAADPIYGLTDGTKVSSSYLRNIGVILTTETTTTNTETAG